MKPDPPSPAGDVYSHQLFKANKGVFAFDNSKLERGEPMHIVQTHGPLRYAHPVAGISNRSYGLTTGRQAI